MPIRILRASISLDELSAAARETFVDFVKAVVDVRQDIMAIGGELHADEESLLLEEGANQRDLWGINIYPAIEGDARVEFDSMINIRPSQGNRSRSVDDEAIRGRILDVVRRLVI